MYLGPHEFQAQSRYFEDSIHFATNSLWFRGYGLTGVSLDGDALRNGTLSLTHACGIFPDGALFHMPQADQLPPVRSIVEDFPPTAESVTLFLGLQKRKPQGANCSPALTAEARYVAEQRDITDETTGTDTRGVKLGRKNIRFFLESELNEDVISLPVARIKRDGAGHFVYDSDFIPTCLQIRASERLMLLVRRLIEILEAKSSSLGRAAAGIASGTQFSPREVANFWLLHCTNSGLSALRHLWMTKRGHPEELYLEMSRLAGALCTFSLDAHPRNLPVYDHDRPEACFEELDRHIRANLETVVPTNCIAIPLAKTADCFWEADVSDSRSLGRARWILGIHAAVGEPELIARTPQLVKVCSAKFVGELVRRAIAGLALTHMPMPPSSVPMQMTSQYFSVSREGPFWDHIVQTQRVGVYVPAELPNAELELFAVLER
ncbi:MAG: type VI secretion system baseplate subunit TssK [Bryobacterales bacterium]|nr:type VI secretion system baseplate subunit TssK [Bryobacterales bacterium]